MTEDTEGALIRAAVRRARSQYPLDVVAAAAGLDEDAFLAWEQGDTSHRADLITLLPALAIDPAAEPEYPHQRAVRSLRNLWSSWGPARGASHDALAAVTEWAVVDDLLGLRANPSKYSPAESLCGRGVPEAADSVFATSMLPRVDLRVPRAQERLDETAERRRIRSAAAAVRAAFLPADADNSPLDPWEIADRHGVPAGLAPISTDAYSATIRTHTAHAVVVSSSFNARVQDRSLLHALLHLAAGHVLAGSVHWVADESDDSISGCSGVPWRACSWIDSIVSELQDPAAAAACHEERLRNAGRGFVPEPPPEPVRQPGEEPGYWEQFPVREHRIPLRRELGLHNRDAVIPGTGQDLWPASLARRWVAVVNRGFHMPLDGVQHFPFGRPGCPTVDDIETARWRARIVDAQLSAANNQPDELFPSPDTASS